MASQDITALFFDQEEIPMALLFGPETVVPGRRCAISSMGATFDRVQVLEALKAMFPSHLQVIVWKNAENLPVSLESMTFEEMEQAVAFKARGEACTIVGDSQLEYNNLKAQYSSAINESERIGVLVLMKNLLFDAIFTNLAANALKSYGTFTNTSTGLAMCLLDYRKLFTVDQARVQTIQNRINRNLARAALPRIQEESKLSAREAEEEKSGADCGEFAEAPSKAPNLPDRTPSGKIRRKISDPSSSSSSSDHTPSSSEVEYPVEGCHTDTEREDLCDGFDTPVVIRTAPDTPLLSSQPKQASQSIPKKKLRKSKSKKSKKSKKSEKPQPKKTRVSNKKAKKHRSRKSKKAVLPPPSSSSSEEDSQSESEESVQECAPVDQVFLV